MKSRDTYDTDYDLLFNNINKKDWLTCPDPCINTSESPYWFCLLGSYQPLWSIVTRTSCIGRICSWSYIDMNGPYKIRGTVYAICYMHILKSICLDKSRRVPLSTSDTITTNMHWTHWWYSIFQGRSLSSKKTLLIRIHLHRTHCWSFRNTQRNVSIYYLEYMHTNRWNSNVGHTLTNVHPFLSFRKARIGMWTAHFQSFIQARRVCQWRRGYRSYHSWWSNHPRTRYVACESRSFTNDREWTLSLWMRCIQRNIRLQRRWRRKCITWWASRSRIGMLNLCETIKLRRFESLFYLFGGVFSFTVALFVNEMSGW